MRIEQLLIHQSLCNKLILIDKVTTTFNWKLWCLDEKKKLDSCKAGWRRRSGRSIDCTCKTLTKSVLGKDIGNLGDVDDLLPEVSGHLMLMKSYTCNIRILFCWTQSWTPKKLSYHTRTCLKRESTKSCGCLLVNRPCTPLSVHSWFSSNGLPWSMLNLISPVQIKQDILLAVAAP